ncbi:HipA domain-containing protein [Bradyrhizobium sp. CCBAU 65884]|uniref:HipA domain-containing protein n=1 Tax=Bradyrhizobium sp. CCBAU 65884 TaxID=722477 RepID=UPI0023052DBA|nr:HipA domain-containing protein [Bradyrhizobium sp. CCBAU 65884]
MRLPQEDCCQALFVPPARKYETDGGPGIRKISDFHKGSDTPEDDQAIFFKAQIVFWLLAATDGHAKISAFIWRQADVFILPRFTSSFRPNRAWTLDRSAKTK